MVSYYFPPAMSAGIWRNYRFAEAFSSFFDRIVVATTTNHRAEMRLPLPMNVEVLRIGTLDYRTLMGLKRSGGSHVSEHAKSGALTQALIKLLRSFPLNLLLGEGGLVYIFLAYRRLCRLMSSRPVAVVYSSFSPYADHVIAHLLKRRYPHLHWIADFRDLQVEPLYRNVYWPRLQRWFERYILARADLLTTVSDGLAKHLGVYGPTLTVPRGIALRQRTDRRFSRFTVCYTGALYRHFRDPSYFLKTLAEAFQHGLMLRADCCLMYAGKDSAGFRQYLEPYGLDDIYEDRGEVSHEEARMMQDQSHMLLLLTSSSPEIQGVMTGKLFEYIESQNPIIALINGTRDSEFEQLFDTLSLGLVVYDPPGRECPLSRYLCEQYLQWQRSGRVRHQPDTGLLASKYSWHHQAQRMLQAAGIATLGVPDEPSGETTTTDQHTAQDHGS